MDDEKGKSKKRTREAIEEERKIRLIVLYFIFLILLIFLSYILGISLDKIWFSESTPRFFFSAVFQGFMALFGILIIAIIYFLDTTNKEIRQSLELVQTKMKGWKILDEYIMYAHGKKLMFKNEKTMILELEKFLKTKGVLHFRTPVNSFVSNHILLILNRIYRKIFIEILFIISTWNYLFRANAPSPRNCYTP